MVDNITQLRRDCTGILIPIGTEVILKKGSEVIENLVKNNSSVGLIFGSHYIAEEVFNAFEIPFDNYYI